MTETQGRTGVTGCGCVGNDSSACEPQEKPAAHSGSEPKLEDLIPIAVVIAAGCESCAEKMVARALEQGSSGPQIAKTLGIVAHMQKLDCLVQAVGAEVVARMEKPLAAGRTTLKQAEARARN